jgi:hypothetical protein
VDGVSSNWTVIPAKAGIQYSRGFSIKWRSRGVLDRPIKSGDDVECAEAAIILTLPAAA